MKSFDDAAWAHGLARLGLGVDIALHGLTRAPNLRGFASGLQEQFAGSILPPPLVFASGYGIAIGEAAIGILLVFGLFLRPALASGSALMIFLLFGTCLIQNWQAAGIQLVYLAFYCALLATARWDRFSLDGWRRGVFASRP